VIPTSVRPTLPGQQPRSLTGYGTFFVLKLRFEIRLICNRPCWPDLFSAKFKDILSEGDSPPLSHGVPGTFLLGAHCWVGRRYGDFFAVFKVVAEELEDLARKGWVAQLRYAEWEKQWEKFLGKRRKSRRAR